MEFLVKSLVKVSNKQELHPVETKELLVRGLIHFLDTPTENEFALTEEGAKYMLYVNSADFASKRYDA